MTDNRSQAQCIQKLRDQRSLIHAEFHGKASELLNQKADRSTEAEQSLITEGI